MRRLALTLAVLLSACRTAPPAPAHGVDLAGMDRSIAAGDDFNGYANGGWLRATTIPPDKSSYGPWAVLEDLTRQRVVALIQDFAKDTSKLTDDERKIGDYYASYMDDAAIEAKGLEPLRRDLDVIKQIGDRQALARVIGSTLRADVDPLNATNFDTEHLFGVFVSQALDDPSHNVPYLLQGGLGMPDRDYYLSSAADMVTLRQTYQAYVAATLKLAGVADAATRAARVVELETKMARIHATRVESEDVHRPVAWARVEFATRAPGVDWNVLFKAAGLDAASRIVVWHPAAVTGTAALVSTEPVDTWKDWLTFHTINEVGYFLPKVFFDNRFGFYGKAMSGALQSRPRWQRGVDLTSDALGEAVGRAYVDQYFPPAAKARVEAMVGDLVKAFDRRIDNLTWMSAETKARAKQKLATLKIGVGYPDKWRDYSGLQIVKGDALGNEQRSSLFEYRHQLAKLSAPVDRGEWWMTPQTINAVNLPLQNALNFPAAFLQPPFFDPDAGTAYNYGSIGAIIGHEISHSFDDQGSQFDAEGRLANWWTADDLKHFHDAAEALAAQYDGYRPFPDLAVNGHQTLSENIADVAGLSAAYDAYRLSLGNRPDADWHGFTGDEQFFISYAQGWRSKDRDEDLRQRIATDGHAPDEYRADTVRNLDPWYSAFAVQPAAKLFLPPTGRVHVW